MINGLEDFGDLRSWTHMLLQNFTKCNVTVLRWQTSDVGIVVHTGGAGQVCECADCNP